VTEVAKGRRRDGGGRLEPIVPAPPGSGDADDREIAPSQLTRVITHNERFAASFDRRGLPAAPRRRLAVLACMDARLQVEEVLGLAPGDAHVIRNAGGLATDDAVRSLVVSRHLLATETVLVVQHTGCGLLGLDEAAARAAIADRTGSGGEMSLGSFGDLDASVREQVETIRSHPWLADATTHGLVYDVATGRLRQVC
jgi:carbonic anhydrase